MRNKLLVEWLHTNYGTISGRTETSGTVAVRSKTAYRRLVDVTGESGATVAFKTTPDKFPALVTVTEPFKLSAADEAADSMRGLANDVEGDE